MKSDSRTSGDLFDDREKTLKLWTLRHCHLVNQYRNKVIGVLQCVANRVQDFCVLLGAVVKIMRSPKQSSTNGFAICRHAY